MQACLDAFTRGMHPYCSGSVPDRGIKMVNQSIKRWLKYDKKCKYFVKLDIRKFFDNISADMLKAALRKRIKDKDILWALDQIIDSAPSACPVGYYTSPWFANVLLQDFDWFVEQRLYKERRGKRVKYARHYMRYVDDILLIGTSKSDLYKAIKEIRNYLLDNYGLQIKDAWEISEVSKYKENKVNKKKKYIDMGGYQFGSGVTIIRDGIYLETRRFAKKIKKRGYLTHKSAQSIMARIGWSNMADSYGFRHNDIKPYIDSTRIRRYIANVDKQRKRRVKQA